MRRLDNSTALIVGCIVVGGLRRVSSSLSDWRIRFYMQQHARYCGIDLHARTMYLCILNQAGAIVLHRNVKTDPDLLLKAIAPFRQHIVIAVECIFTWYWLANLCAREGIAFVLGHVSLKTIRQAKPTRPAGENAQQG